ncbi:MAG: hypothetical protein M3464_06170 [Chloroflexota bacterium]|nr:hypothetical protein [Chloroflexota bacterium]
MHHELFRLIQREREAEAARQRRAATATPRSFWSGLVAAFRSRPRIPTTSAAPRAARPVALRERTA